MIVIDKLCYQSKLRYENPGGKFAFAVITLCICVMSRSIAVACIVLAVTGILTVWKGGIPVSRYLKFLTIPLAFLLLSTLAIILNLKKAPLDLFAIPLGNWYLTSSRAALICRTVDSYCTFRGFLSVLPGFYYTYAGYFRGSKETALSQTSD